MERTTSNCTKILRLRNMLLMCKDNHQRALQLRTKIEVWPCRQLAGFNERSLAKINLIIVTWFVFKLKYSFKFTTYLSGYFINIFHYDMLFNFLLRNMNKKQTINIIFIFRTLFCHLVNWLDGGIGVVTYLDGNRVWRKLFPGFHSKRVLYAFITCLPRELKKLFNRKN